MEVLRQNQQHQRLHPVILLVTPEWVQSPLLQPLPAMIPSVDSNQLNRLNFS
jgi:hypothetical protein